MTKYRIVFWYDNWTSQPFEYDVTDEQVALQVFHALLEHGDFLLAREDRRGSLYKAKTKEQLAKYQEFGDYRYLDEDDDEYWDEWVSPDGLSVYDYLKTKTRRL